MSGGSPLQRFDARLERFACEHRGGNLDATAHLLSAGADRTKLWLAAAALRGRIDPLNGRRAALRCVAALALGTVINDAVKRRIGRPRPTAEVRLRFGVRPQSSPSFPSGHALSAALAANLLAEDMPGWGPPLALVAAGVGWSRVQVGLHHPSDVIGGMAIGVATATVIRRLWPLRSAG